MARKIAAAPGRIKTDGTPSRRRKIANRILSSYLIWLGGAVLLFCPSASASPVEPYGYAVLPSVTMNQLLPYCGMSGSALQTYRKSKSTEAVALSERLEQYIRRWYSGEAPAELPRGLLPASMDNAKTRRWTLLRPEEVDASKQWVIRPAHEIPSDHSALNFLSPDNHVTYGNLIFVAPLDSELLVEGDFPHARFMSLQISPPFDPKFPRTSASGAPEVPIVDVDIDPDPGHTNPFRLGSDRNARQRHYHVAFGLKAGDAIQLNPRAMLAPAFRAPGNHRTGGPFSLSGPLGGGRLVASVLWLRYYAPDHSAGPLGGVSLPRALLRLKTGETFWLQADSSGYEQLVLPAVPGYETAPVEPLGPLGSQSGWLKMFGYLLTATEGQFIPDTQPWGWLPKAPVSGYLMWMDRCLYNRGADRPGIGGMEGENTYVPYISYLVRPLALGRGKVYALTGKLPLTPRTRDGEATPTRGDARYWSLCHIGNRPENPYPGVLYGCLMDDEVQVNPNGDFLIVYSRASERPANARLECGVTWQDFGPESIQNFNLRWMSVMPDDHLPEYSPHAHNLPWATADWAQPEWDQSLIGYNKRGGVMGPYQPLIHYLSKARFESLGCPVDPSAVPNW